MNSSVYQDITKSQLQLIIGTALNTRVLQYSSLTGGLFNTTYLVDTAEYGLVVLRVGPINRHLLMPFERDLMKSEETVYALCKARRIPVSEVLVCDTTKSLLDRDYMIVRHIPSRPMNEVQWGADDLEYVCHDVGVAMRKFHSIEGAKFGRIAEVKKGGGFKRWSDCILTEFARWETVAAPTGLYSTDEHKEIWKILTKAAPILDEITVPHLCHCDLWFGNILVTPEEHPKFAAVIDADRAMWGDPELDFFIISWTEKSAAFWKGYGKALEAKDNSKIRRLIYTLMWALFDSYVYHNQYNAPESAAQTKQRALDQMYTLHKYDI